MGYFSVLTIFLLVSISAFGNDYKCFIISGLKRDHNGAVYDTPTMKSKSVKGMKCEIFDSWTSLEVHLKTLSPQKILIYQGAHGLPGGVAQFNSGDEQAENIIKGLQDFSQQGFHIGYLSASCFSGDLLKKLIAVQTLAPPNKKLCVLTDAYMDKPSMNREMMLSDAIENTSSGSSLNDVFKNMIGGMSSAAAWSDTGIDLHFANQSLLNPSIPLAPLDSYASACGLDNPLNEFYKIIKANPRSDLLVHIADFIGYLRAQEKISKQVFLTKSLSRQITTLSENRACVEKVYKDFLSLLFQGKETVSIFDIFQTYMTTPIDVSCQKLKFSKRALKQNKEVLESKEKTQAYFYLQPEMSMDSLLQQLISSTPGSDGLTKRRINGLDLYSMFDSYNRIRNEPNFEINSSSAKLVSLRESLTTRENLSLKELSQASSDFINPLDAFMRGSLIKKSTNTKDINRYEACEEFKL
jgi:hypothetical protein